MKTFVDTNILVYVHDRAGADILLSEDLNPGQRYGDVLVENPFISP